MLTQSVNSYLAVRRACGYQLKSESNYLRTFAIYSEERGKHHVCSETAIEWAGLSKSAQQRARRLGQVIRFARYLRVEDPSHELPPAVFGSEKRPRPTPYIFSQENIKRLIHAASQSNYPSFHRQTYSTLFSLMACTGLRASEAIRLCLDDITEDGLIIKGTKFRKSRLVPLHPTAQAGLERYLEQRRPYAPFNDHVFVSLKRKSLLIYDVEYAFKKVVKKIGIERKAGLPHPTPHSLRHTFAVRALEACPDDRDKITKHMLALSTYLGHGTVKSTYWYLEATPDLMRNISISCERFMKGGQP